MNNLKEISLAATTKLEHVVSKIKNRKWHPIGDNLETIQHALDIKTAQPRLTGFCAFAEYVTGWIPLNPNNLEKTRALVSVYHLPGSDSFDPRQVSLEIPHPISQRYGHQEDYREVSILPSSDGLLSLYKSLVHHRSPLIYISGKRGAGKTLALNFFLATAHRGLMKEGVLWLRTDVAKLWSYPEDFLTVAQYTVLHSLFVALRYASDDENLTAMKDQGALFLTHLQNLLIHESSASEVIKAWRSTQEAYEGAIRRGKAEANSKPVADFLMVLQRAIVKDSNFIFFDLYKEFLSFLKEKASSKGKSLKIVIILDGIDNIRVGAHQDRYFKFLQQIIEIFSEFPIKLGDKFLLVARPETFDDIAFMRTSMPNGHAAPQVFEINSDFVQGILDKKRSSINEPVAFFQAAAKAYIGYISPSPTARLQFSESIKFLLERLESADRFGKPNAQSSAVNTKQKFQPLQSLFDGNIRSLLRNCIRAHYHCINLPDVSRERTLLEGSILAGCSAMPDNFDENVHGHWCPNIFQDATINNKRWTGLALLRLIQLLNVCASGITRHDAIQFLMRTFGYPEALLETAFQTAAEFSLLHPVGNKLRSFDEERVRPRQVRLFASTEKGRYILRLIFNDYATMYFMSTGTPLYLQQASASGVELKQLVHSFKEDRHFFRSAIVSGTILWAHIFFTDSQERNALRKTMRAGESSFTNAAFEISGLNNWPDIANSLVRRLFRKDLDIVRAALASYFQGIPFDTSEPHIRNQSNLH